MSLASLEQFLQMTQFTLRQHFFDILSQKFRYLNRKIIH